MELHTGTTLIFCKGARGTFHSSISANLIAYREGVTTGGKSVQLFARRCRVAAFYRADRSSGTRGLRDRARSGAIARTQGHSLCGLFEMVIRDARRACVMRISTGYP